MKSEITPAFRANTTQVPNFILDSLLNSLNETELKIVLLIARKTYGWHKDYDQISLSQFIKLTGQSDKSIKKARKSLIEKGIIGYDPGRGGKDGHGISSYFIATPGKKVPPHGGEESSATPGKKVPPTKETITKENSDRAPSAKAESFPILSLEREEDARSSVILVRTEYESLYKNLTGNSPRWNGKQTKIANKLLREFPAERIVANLHTLKDQVVANSGKYGWAFTMEKLDWKWGEVETARGVEEEQYRKLRQEIGL